MMDINANLFQQFIYFLINNFLAVILKMKIGQTKNQLKNYTKQLLETLKKRKLHLPFIDNICADIADIQLISKFNEEIHFLFCVIDIFSKCAQVFPLKDKKVLQLLMIFK